MDAIGMLKQDHAVVMGLFDWFQALRENAEVARRAVAERIIKELSIHAAIEEQYFYPYAKQRDERLSRLVYRFLEEHNVAKWQLSALEKLSPADPRFGAKMAVMMQSVRLHIEEEEDQLFPRLAMMCDRAELEALGDTLRHAKQAAPTHPHPRAADEPAAIAMAAPVLAAMDRGRDFASVTFKRTGQLVERLRDGAKAFTRQAGKRTAKAARAMTQPKSRRKTVSRAQAAKKRTARKRS